MKIREYLPNYFEGFDLKTYEIETLRQLYELPYFKSYIEGGYLLCLDYKDSSCSYIIAVEKANGTELDCKWWVIATIREDAKKLFFWGMLDWKSIINGLRFIKGVSSTQEILNV
jgi:hypothetical protein